MTLDEAVGLSLLVDLPRADLTARLQADPLLLELAASRAGEARHVRTRAEARGIGVIAWNMAQFPAGLRAIPDCPPALWYRGRLDALSRPMVAVVGSRAASVVAIDTAVRLGQGLAAVGVSVVSGLARGVDSAAHRGALRTGTTVAVLGSGVDRIYPAEHSSLADQVAGSGVVLSEYAPGTQPLPAFFPMRNRLISGLAVATVVVEAAEKSGSLITARCAADQGREVMVVPGSVAAGRNKGGHALLRDGAALVESAEDVLAELGWRVHPVESEAAPTEQGDPILRNLRPDEPTDLDGLAAASGLSVPRILQRLGELELLGKVERAGGGRFVRRS